MHKVHSRLVFVVLLVMIGALLAGLRPCASTSPCGCADKGAGGRADQRTRKPRPSTRSSGCRLAAALR